MNKKITQKHASHIFQEWMKDQYIFQEVLLENMPKQITEKHIEKLKKNILKQSNKLNYFLSFYAPTKSLKTFSKLTTPTEKDLRKQFEKLYIWLQKDISKFIDHLLQTPIVSPEVNSIEKKEDVDIVINRYKKLFDYLFEQKNEQRRLEYLLVIANNFFEFCFSPKTFPLFKEMLQKPIYHPIVRLIYSIMWSNLAQTGWQHWHVNTIKKLKEEVIRGKEIVYIAGGTDIYQLIKHGIYNIRIIDPFLSSQPRYYAKDWEWFIKDDNKFHGVGDQIIVPVDNKTLIMERVLYKESNKKFTAHLSTKKKERIPESESIWKIFFQSKPKRTLGHIIIDRKFVQQSDFKASKKQALLISFNELFFVAAPTENCGWGIDVRKFEKNVKVYVKQLRTPVTKEIMKNMRYEAGQEDFCFINLGTCVD